MLLTIGTPTNLFSQSKAEKDITDFLIVIKVADDEIKLSCKKGCAWKDLSFNIALSSKTQAIDQYGMTKIPRTDVKEDPKLSNFLFTVKITEEGLCLNGKEGTAWKNLKLGCPGNDCTKTIDQHGTAEADEE